MESDYVIETKGLSYHYSGSKLLSLDDVNIKIKRGVKTVLLGANGAGKSTLFFQFNGVFKPTKGEVLYNGVPLEYSKKGLISLRSDVAVMLQNPDDQIFSATVEEDVAFGPMNMGLPMEEVTERIEEAMFVAGVLKFRERPTAQLSYGQRKRVALAGAIAMRPKVLIMDEPSAGLDPQMAMELMELAEQLHNMGTTVVISTHDVDLAYSWADEIHVLRGGNLIFSGQSENFYNNPIEVHLAGLYPPAMFTTNTNMCTLRGEDVNPYPRTQSQLLSKISNGSGNLGTLKLLPVDNTANLSLLDDTHKGVRLGVYGINARKATHHSKAQVDFIFNAVENCFTECMLGRDSILSYDIDMENVVMDMLKRLEAFGTILPYAKISLPSN